MKQPDPRGLTYDQIVEVVQAPHTAAARHDLSNRFGWSVNRIVRYQTGVSKAALRVMRDLGIHTPAAQRRHKALAAMLEGGA